ncbi:tetratricopeptide repeat protein [Ferrimonas aestuarii]|uniref:Tetratricopeptide repeat protein n=1 Tax=Ferrimonas aestuarii TaxID=2569539 RepID=A0A4U1BQP1_9GAMM|nr:tetratricopeptide repeat protein [Ferrimonas aestuarii]TKB56736.1 tetratricopeptide repeat protein [Ferrimonas aestuarii]
MPCLKQLCLTLLFVTGCASTTQPQFAPPQWLDSQFSAMPNPVEVDQLFELSPQMRQFLSNEFRLRSSDNQKIKTLSTLVSKNQGFEYDNSHTRVASVTFEHRAGNCMSLVLMTAAMAKFWGLGVEYQLVKSPPLWDRQGGVHLLNEHVNIRVYSKDSVWSSVDTSVIIDFLPGSYVRGYQTERLSEAQIIARFFNNLGAEALVAGDANSAYHYLKRALEVDPKLPEAWNTLGVLYRRQGLESDAERVYRFAIDTLPESTNALHNFALLLASQDRLTEWSQVHRRLELARLANPFFYYDMAEWEYRQGNFSEALSQYRKAVKLADYHHEFHFGLSRAYFQLGEIDRSQASLSRAYRLAPQSEKQRYQLKLNALSSWQQ